MTDTLTIRVKRLGTEGKRVSVPYGATVAEAIAKAGFKLGASDKAWVNGDEIALDAECPVDEDIVLQPDVKYG